jgi:hypothetical protein
MTVQELIDKLLEVEDTSMDVWVFDSEEGYQFEANKTFVGSHPSYKKIMENINAKALLIGRL